MDLELGKLCIPRWRRDLELGKSGILRRTWLWEHSAVCAGVGFRTVENPAFCAEPRFRIRKSQHSAPELGLEPRTSAIMRRMVGESAWPKNGWFGLVLKAAPKGRSARTVVFVSILEVSPQDEARRRMPGFPLLKCSSDADCRASRVQNQSRRRLLGFLTSKSMPSGTYFPHPLPEPRHALLPVQSLSRGRRNRFPRKAWNGWAVQLFFVRSRSEAGLA